jgi:hypothetical protein
MKVSGIGTNVGRRMAIDKLTRLGEQRESEAVVPRQNVAVLVYKERERSRPKLSRPIATPSYGARIVATAIEDRN